MTKPRTPQERWVKAQDRLQAEALYVELGKELTRSRDPDWRAEAMRVRREIEGEYGPQGRTTWQGRKHVTIPKPAVLTDHAVTLVLHDPVTGEPLQVRALDQLGLPPAIQEQILRAVRGVPR